MKRGCVSARVARKVYDNVLDRAIGGRVLKRVKGLVKNSHRVVWKRDAAGSGSVSRVGAS